jgi:hypothetical protein
MGRGRIGLWSINAIPRSPVVSIQGVTKALPRECGTCRPPELDANRLRAWSQFSVDELRTWFGGDGKVSLSPTRARVRVSDLIALRSAHKMTLPAVVKT